MRQKLPRMLAHSSMTVLLLAAPLTARAQTAPYPCPLSYGFFTTYDFISDRNYQYTFMFNIGLFLPSVVGPAVGSYMFPPMTSIGGDARLTNGRIAAHCTAGLFVIPPYQKPQLVLYVIDDGASGNLEVIYSPGGDCDNNVEQLIYDPNDGSGEPGNCSGGGGDEGGSDPGNGSGSGGSTTCTQYVEEISYDGGEHWTVIDSWWECE